jgi:quercetin dioxygenase-like cupin family protein
MHTTTDTPTGPARVTADQAQTRAFLGGIVTIRLGAEQTGGWLCVHDHEMPRGTATPLHVQPGDDESFLVLSGEIDFHVDGDVVRAGPNDALHIPRGTPHAFQVASPTARLLILGTPAGHERFFLEAGDPVDAPAPPDLERMTVAARNVGVELLGPPPFDAPAGR